MPTSSVNYSKYVGPQDTTRPTKPNPLFFLESAVSSAKLEEVAKKRYRQLCVISKQEKLFLDISIPLVSSMVHGPQMCTG